MKRLWREPLVHFLLIGALLFAVWAVLGGPPGPESDRIVVTAGQVANLDELFRRTWDRPPTADERRGMVDDFVREEIFYREALAMGLDRDDTIVRRRLRQKLEFVAQDLASAEIPTDADLEAFLAEHAERFRRDATVTFEHVFLSVDRRGASARADASSLLERLRAGGTAAGAAGDPLVLPSRLDAATLGEVRRNFGDGFASALAELPLGGWQGPVESGYGLHLVRIGERTPGWTPPLSEIRERVEDEWRSARRREANEELYRRLRRRYEIEVEVEVEELDAARAGGPR